MSEFRASIGISSEELDPDEITRRTGLTPDRTGRRGEPPRPGVRARPFHLWVKKIVAESSTPRVEDLEKALLAWGEDTAGVLGRLAGSSDATIWLTIVQEVDDPEDSWYRGIPLSAELIRWLATARASVGIDQYFEWNSGEPTA